MILETIHRSTKHLESPPDLPTEAIRALGRICLNRKKARSVKGKEPEWVRSPYYFVQETDHIVELGDIPRTSYVNITRKKVQADV
jgi:hypothetical protein